MWGTAIFLILLVIALIWFVRWVKHRNQPKYLSVRRMKHAETQSNARTLAQLGRSHAERSRVIDSAFETRSATLSSTYFADLHTFKKGEGKKKRYVMFTVSRNLAGMDNRERTYLKTAELWNSATDGKTPNFRKWRTALIWGDGKGVEGGTQYLGLDKGEEANPTAAAVKRHGMTVDQTITAMQQYATSVLQRPDVAPDLRTIAAELNDAMAPSQGGSWLRSTQVATSPFGHRSDYPLYIGSLADGTPLSYSGDGSMVSIAPPGSGKTQCNVFPNLLTWNGPAVVLDISGDIYEHTANWRAQHIGPVYKFSPLEPDTSNRYNPLTFVRREPDDLWGDSRLLAEMMIVPALSSDPFWENEARTVLTAAIAYVCYSNPPDQRPMRRVLDILFGGKPWDEMILGLRMAIDVHVMTQHATALSGMNEKTRSSVLQVARSSLNAWTGERIARATMTSDWSPSDLRGPTKPTIYIYIRPNEVESYLSLLRVFIGQHIRILTGGPVPHPMAPPILFMLDELPRLRNMPPVDEALNIGRKYGLRLWMFAQSVGQFQAAYENADGMLGSCAVRIFMNPSGADGVAERISEELGNVDSLQDNSRKRLVEAVELAGPTFRDLQIVLASGAKPAVVAKNYAYRNPEFVRRMSLPPATARAISPTTGAEVR